MVVTCRRMNSSVAAGGRGRIIADTVQDLVMSRGRRKGSERKEREGKGEEEETAITLLHDDL